MLGLRRLRATSPRNKRRQQARVCARAPDDELAAAVLGWEVEESVEAGVVSFVDLT